MADTDKGKPHEYDPNFKGPTASRSCTDILFMLLFLLFWVGMFVVAGYAVDRGDISRLVYPTDSFNNTCGSKNSDLPHGVDLNSKKYLYWPNTQDTTVSVCVSHCPSDSAVSVVNTAIGNCGLLTHVVCPDVPKSQLIRQDYNNKTQACCPYRTQSLFYRCVPLNDTTRFLHDAISKNIDASSTGFKVVGDIANTWHWILLSCFVAVLFGFLWMWILEQFAGIIVWVTLAALVCSMAALSAIVWRYGQQSETVARDPSYPAQFTGIKVDGMVDNTKVAKITAYVLIAITGTLILALIFLRGRVRIAIAVLKEAAEALKAIPSALFFPLTTFAALVVLMIYWIYIFLLLVSAYKKHPTLQTDKDTEKTLNYFSIYHFFGLLWTAAFFTAIAQCTLAGAFAMYYFARDKRALPFSPVLTALKNVVFYHLGSMALGSFILAFVQFLRAVNAYMQAQMKKQNPPAIVKFAMSCLSCLLYCIEQFVKFLNKNAYITIAIYGCNFCSAGKKAFQLLMRNILRVAAVTVVGDFIMFLSKLAISGFTTVVAVGIFRHSSEDLSFWMAPALLVLLLSYIIADAFIIVYEMAVDTILLCFLEDCERNDPKKGRPYFMSDRLREALGAPSAEQEMQPFGGEYGKY